MHKKTQHHQYKVSAGVGFTMQGLFHLVALLSLVPLLLHCSDADTLGDEPPVEFQVTGDLTYENGINQLLEVKCGYCHGWPVPPVAPDGIVDDLDLNTYETRLVNGKVIRGADALGIWIFEGILDHEVVKFNNTSAPRKMPLDFGTPLTSNEKTLLTDWDAAGAPRNSTAQPFGDPNAGASLYTPCASCHIGGGGFQIGDNLWQGPPLRREAITTAKLKSMWLHKLHETEQRELSDQEAADLRAYILTVLLPENQNR